MFIAMLGTTMGDIFMAKLMRPYEKVKFSEFSQIQDLVIHLLTSHLFWMGIGCFLTFFVLWLTVLSYEDLSFALPMTAINYILNAILVGPMLGEVVTPLRWTGTIIIGVGVILVSISEGKEKNKQASA